jgi:excisionase family DNA binding protein
MITGAPPNDIDWSRRTQPMPEVCKVLGIGISTGYKAARDGQIPSIRVAGRVLVPTHALRRLLQLDEGS